MQWYDYLILAIIWLEINRVRNQVRKLSEQFEAFNSEKEDICLMAKKAAQASRGI